MDELTITKPDDWHLHLRDGEHMRAVVGDSARRFARAIVMPNLKPPVTTTALALAYRQRILDALPRGSGFQPLMTLYLTDNTSPEEIERAKASGAVYAVKYYPAGATTNSDSGVTDIRRCDATLQAMADAGMPLLVHGEVTDPEVDVFDRERVFIERVLVPLAQRFPRLKLVMEHITTSEAVAFVSAASERIAATITAHHLLLNRNAIFQGGIRPHNYCLPVLKRETHRRALVRAATSGNPKFFLGTDSAPHARHTKETSCGCAGCIPPTPASSCMPRPSRQPVHWIGWRASPACSAPISTGCHATGSDSRCAEPRGKCPRSWYSGRIAWCRCGPGSRWGGS